MLQKQNTAACIMGALVADAASLGLHWIYDVERIENIVEHNGGKATFVPIAAENYEGVRSYFAHENRSDGMLSQYGECLNIAIQSMVAHEGKFDVPSYQEDFVNVFGAGGTYQGYIDRPTRGCLENIANDILEPSGIDDDQLPSTSRLPAIVAAYRSSGNFASEVEKAIGITNVNEAAYAYGQVFANLLSRVLGGMEIKDAMNISANETSDDIKELLLNALQSDEENSIAYGEITGRACHLPMGMPLMFHILSHSKTFVDAVEINIKAGGDSCGRAVMIGAIMGAEYGVAEEEGIPLEWVLQMQDATNLWAQCRALAKLI